MASRARRIVVEFLGEDRDLLNSVDRVESATSGMGKTMARIGKAALVGLGVAGAAAARGLYEVAEGAAADEQSTLKLATTIRNSTKARQADIDKVEDWITAQGRALGVTDDELRPALARLVVATKDVGEAQRLTSLAMDVAAGTGKSLESVTVALQKAQNGSLSGLSRLGVATKDAAGETLTLDEVTKNLARTYEGQAAKAAGTAAGSLDRLKLIVDEAGESIGYRLLPYVVQFADYAEGSLVPALDKVMAGFDADGIDGAVAALGQITDLPLVPVLEGIEDAASDVWTIFSEGILPVLGDLSGSAAGVLTPLGALDSLLDFLADHTDLARAAFELWLGVMAYQRIAPVVGGIAELATNMSKAELQTGKLAAAAKNAAGAAGFAAIIASTGETNEALSTFEKVAGGALLGFSAGGPWGAAIGGGAALIYDLATSTDNAAESLKDARPPAVDFSSALDDISGAAQRGIKVLALHQLTQDGAVAAGNKLGISTRDLVGAMLDNEGATRRVQAALDAAQVAADGLYDVTGKNNQAYMEATQAISDFRGTMAGSKAVLVQQQEETRATALATENLAKVFRGVPPKVVTDFKQNGLPQSEAAIAALVKKYDLAREDVRTIIRQTGVDTTVREIDTLIGRLGKTKDGADDANRNLERVGRTTPDFNPFLRGLGKDLDAGVSDATLGGLAMSRSMERELEKTRANLSPFQTSFGVAIQRARDKAAAGGLGIGNDLEAGLLQGIFGAGDTLAGRLAAMVNQGIAAARRAADSHSPSRKMIELGHDMVDGAVIGVESGQGELDAALARLVAGALDTVRGAGGAIIDELAPDPKSLVPKARDILKDYKGALREDLDKLAEFLDGKGADLFAAIAHGGKDKAADAKDKLREAMASIVDGIKADGAKALEQIDALVGQAKDTLTSLVDARAEFADGFASFTSSVFGKDNGDGGPLAGVNDFLTAQAAELQKALQLKDDVAALIDMGLSDDLLTQLQAQGEAGLANIHALATTATQEQIDALNLLNQQTADALAEAGAQAGDAIYGSAIEAAQANLAELEDLRGKVKEMIADTLKDARELMHGTGKEVVLGLIDGITSELGHLQSVLDKLRSAAAEVSAVSGGGSGAYVGGSPTGGGIQVGNVGGIKPGGGLNGSGIYVPPVMPGGGTTVVEQPVSITVQGDSDPIGAARRIQQQLLLLRRQNGGAGLGLS